MSKRMVDIEVRSSGPGPRAALSCRTFSIHLATDTNEIEALAGLMGCRWRRPEPDRKGRVREVSDGVSIIIRRVE